MSTSTIQRVAAGDSLAVEDCLARFGPLVWSLARQLSTTRADAEDAVQEIFIDLWRSAHRYDPAVASEATFVAMIARRRLIDRRRRQTRAPATDALDEQSVPAAARPIDAVELAEEAACARDCLAELASDQQRVLKLSIYDGLSQSNIAEQTGLPLGTVKTHARRGLMRLRELMRDRFPELAHGGAE